MIFPNGTIRVLTPITEDGNRPKLDRSGQQEWKEDFFPLSAQRHFERRNSRLPNHLKKKIEVVGDGDVDARATGTQVVADTITAPVTIKKRGPKPKSNAQSN